MITCYAQKSKKKSQLVLEAFAAGSGAKMAWTDGKLEPGAAVFYGVRPEWAHLWKQCKAEGRDWYYIDNSYFDVSREKYFRVTKNAIQHNGQGRSDCKRFDALGITIRPMRNDGDTAVVCLQSEEFMRTVADNPNYYDATIGRLSGKVIVRRKNETRPLLEDLKNASCVYTWSSASAVTALLEGVEVVTSNKCCACFVSDRRMWAGVLADNQWTLEEMAICGTVG